MTTHAPESNMRWLHATRAPDAPDAASLPPVRIFTADLELDGFIAPTGQRVTDQLLRGQDLAFLPAGATPEPENWVAVAPNEVLFVVPPPLPDRPAVPAELELATVSIEIESYRVDGTVRVPRGEEVGIALSERYSFVPVTSATVMRGAGPPEEVGVAIVNLARAASLHLVA